MTSFFKKKYYRTIIMKKTLAIILLVIAAFTGCKKDDQSLFNKSPDDRLNEAIAAYQAKLTDAPDGWKGFVYPKSGGVYSFYFKFDNANRVKMLSSFDSASAVNLKESSYRLKALQQPSLLFDTYSYLHVLADPNPNVNGGALGAGLQSDFEFYFDSSSADTINLVGRFNGSKATLIKATPEEAAGYVGGQLAQGFLLNKLLTYFERLTIGSETFDFHIEPSARTLSFLDATGNLLDTMKSTRYYMTYGGIGFIKPIAVGNQIITGLSNINYNPSSQMISCTVNNTAAAIKSVTVPLRVDVNAPRRWWNYKAASEDYWFSLSGFHVNGVDNAYRLDTLTAEGFPFYFLLYWPSFRTENDLFAPIFVDVAGDSLNFSYGSAPKAPAYTSDGRAVFTESGSYGTYPAAGPAANTARQLYSSRGFYFVQTSQTTYDMVSALDEKSWINWY
jgi:hypothetical protein